MAPVLSKTPETLVTSGWSDYALLDSGDGKKLERYGRFTVVRPEPQCLWSPREPAAWGQADAVFDPEDEDEAEAERQQDIFGRFRKDLYALGYPPALVKRALFLMDSSVGASRQPALLPDPAQDAAILQILRSYGLAG